MHIICLTPLEPGVYNDHNADHISTPPDGWAYIPEGFPLPSTFPRLGSLEAEEMTYAREVEVQKEVIEWVDTGEVNEDGEGIMERRTEMETVMETQEYTMMTVTSMTEGTLPDPAPEMPTQLDIIEAQVTYTALMTDTLLEV